MTGLAFVADGTLTGTQTPIVALLAPSAPDLLAASDSGLSNIDNVTNVSMPTFTGTGENGATVTLFDGSTTIGTGIVAGGTWSITATTALA